jgi:hypothetical protein
LTGCRRRKAKRQATPNERWLHLGARQAGQMRTIQTVMATTSVFCMSLNHFRALILAAGTVVTAQADLAVLDAAFDSVSVTLVAFLGLLRATHVADAVLFDIPFHEEAAPQQYTRSKNLRLADLNDVQALKMTHFSQSLSGNYRFLFRPLCKFLRLQIVEKHGKLAICKRRNSLSCQLQQIVKKLRKSQL